MHSDNKRKIVTNVIWATIGKVVRLLTEFIVGVFVARYLGPDQYGMMNYVISIVSLFSIVAAFGLDNIEIRELAKNNKPKELLLGTSFYFRIALSVITYLLVIICLIITKADRETFILVLIYALSIVFSSFNVIRNYFTSIVQNKYIVMTEIARSVIGASIKLGLLLLHASLIWFIVALVFDAILIAGGYFTSYQKKIGYFSQWRFDNSVARYYIKEAFPLMLSGASVIIYQRIDQIMIRNMIDNASLGYFSVALRFSEFLMFIPMVISQTVTPLLVKEYQENRDHYMIQKQRFLDIIVWFSVLLAVSTSLLSYWLVTLTFGEKYSLAIPILQILAFKVIGSALSNASGHIIILEGKQKWASLRNLLGCIVCVVSNYILIPKNGVIGSAWATLITMAFSGFLGNLLIPPYREVFGCQVKALTSGWFRIIKKYKL